MMIMIANDLPDEVTHLVALAPHLFPARDVWEHLDDRVEEGGDEILSRKISVVPMFLFNGKGHLCRGNAFITTYQCVE